MLLHEDEFAQSLSPPATAGRQRLSTADRVLLAVNQSLREQGSAGFETQMLVWLSGRIEAGDLRAAMAQIGERNPVMTAHLVESEQQGGPFWRFRPESRCSLRETSLASAEPEAVLKYAAQLLSGGGDLERSEPIRFHLLRRPNGHDVFLMQYNHTLMDNRAALGLLQEINRCFHGRPEAPNGLRATQRDFVRGYLQRYERSRRTSAALKMTELWGQITRGGATMLGHPIRDDGKPLRFGIAARSLPPCETSALTSRVVRVCGFPSLSMAILGSAFRAIDRLTPPGRGSRNFVAGIGIDLGPRDRSASLFQNMLSIVPSCARQQEIGDRDQLVRILSRQLKDRLEQEVDLGMVQHMAIFCRRPRHARWVLDALFRHTFSLWYAYFGSQDAAGERLCDVDIDQICFSGPAWSPMGISLIANQFHDRLFLQATYLPDSVPDDLANRFLDEVVDDLSF
jgi:condensation domain-containing protein